MTKAKYIDLKWLRKQQGNEQLDEDRDSIHIVDQSNINNS